MRIIKRFIAALAVLCCMLQADGRADTILRSEGSTWHVGFGMREILPDENSPQPLYIAGYNNGLEITGVLDYCQARAIWLDTGTDGILLISIDCIALDSETVARIRNELADLPNCASVNVISTHTHAGPDTLGLWGPVGINGKNEAYMDALIQAAVGAAREAAGSTKPGMLCYGWIETENMFRDSRNPVVYEERLFQLRFVPEDGNSGVRVMLYGAHAEALRGSNTLLSRDYPVLLCDQVEAATGDRALFLPGSIGGLIMTKEFVADTDTQAVRNLTITADYLTDATLSICPDDERVLSPRMRLGREEMEIPLDNPVFLLYGFLGILGNRIVPGSSATGYLVQSELSVLLLDDIAIALIPGEIFPELVNGSDYGHANILEANPTPLRDIADSYGVQDLMIAGLANDELGYIVPPSDFLVHQSLPYLERRQDMWGEDHYEETNSVGPSCAVKIAEAFAEVMHQLTK